jgi:hypothetical protein
MIIKRFDDMNESIRDHLKPKSKENIEKELEGLSPKELLKISSENGHFEGVKKALELIEHPKETEMYGQKWRELTGIFNDALSEACEKGYLDIVKLLLKDDRVDPYTDSGDNRFFEAADNNNHIDICIELLKDERVRDDTMKTEAVIMNVIEQKYDEELANLFFSSLSGGSKKNKDIIEKTIKKFSTTDRKNIIHMMYNLYQVSKE